MSCFFHQLSSRAAFILHRRFVGVTGCPFSPWRRITNYSVASGVDLEPGFAGFCFHRCSSSSSTTTSLPSPAPKRKSRSRKWQMTMDEEREAFYVVRKGDLVGVYKTLSDCRAQFGASIFDPPVSVCKGYSLAKGTEDYLLSRGLQNALYTFEASDLRVDLFGTLVPCSFQEEPSFLIGEAMKNDLPQKRPQEAPGSKTVIDGSVPVERDQGSKQVKLDYVSSDSCSCILEFDGASKGNPGQAGAGVVLRDCDGSVICKLRQGLGVTTCNAAEYRAVLLGLKSALERGCTSIHVQGDSKLVCMQLQDLWKVRDQNLSKLHTEAKKLKEKFSSFQISHVLRAVNCEADVQANLGIKLADGQIEEDLLDHTK